MNRYLILRENEQHGPFTFDEIAALGLQSSDLVCVEGRSSDWTDPADVPELSALARNDNQLASDLTETFPPYGFVYESLPYAAHAPEPGNVPEPGILNEGSSGGLQDRFQACLVRRRTREHPGLSRARVLLLSFLAGGLLLSSLTLHSLLDPTYRGKAASALKDKKTGDRSREPDEYQTALRFETVPKPDTLMEMKPATVIRPKGLHKMVLVKGSRYDVGRAIGMKNLQLTVSNKSSHTIEKATIALDYLRPNGSLIWSERFTVQHLKGHASRTVEVPSLKRVGHVRYRVTDVQSGRYTDELKQL